MNREEALDVMYALKAELKQKQDAYPNHLYGTAPAIIKKTKQVVVVSGGHTLFVALQEHRIAAISYRVLSAFELLTSGLSFMGDILGQEWGWRGLYVVEADACINVVVFQPPAGTPSTYLYKATHALDVIKAKTDSLSIFNMVNHLQVAVDAALDAADVKLYWI